MQIGWKVSKLLTAETGDQTIYMVFSNLVSRIDSLKLYVALEVKDFSGLNMNSIIDRTAEGKLKLTLTSVYMP